MTSRGYILRFVIILAVFDIGVAFAVGGDWASAVGICIAAGIVFFLLDWWDRREARYIKELTGRG